MAEAFRVGVDGRVPVRFSFDGVAYVGRAGDTLAAALLANGVHLVARSFKYHRPRGIMAAGSEETNALVTVTRDAGRQTPNLQATQVEIFEGLRAESQNRSPSLRFDWGAVNDVLAPLFPAGFYYKTFMGPAGFWQKVYEPKIRAAAGMGRAPERPDPDRYANRFAHCDVLVIGSGPAGLAAAASARAAGARVILCDEQPELGGSALHETTALIDGLPARDWAVATAAQLEAAGVTLLTRTTAFGWYADNYVALAQRLTDHLASPSSDSPREKLWQVRARRVVIATGAIERPLVFPENDRPGILLAEAARTYLHRYGVLPGRRVAVFTACDSAYRAALDLKAAGAEVPVIADLRPEGGALTAITRAAGIRVETGATVCGTTGRLRLSGVRLGRVGADGSVRRLETVRCDALLMSGGWTPSMSLFSQSRGKVRFDEATGSFLPGQSHDDEQSAGACNGTLDLAAALAEGADLGAAAAEAAGFAVSSAPTFTVTDAVLPEGGFLGACPHDRDPRRAKAFVDFQHDVTAKDIKLATREGFRSIEHVKRYTTTGMAADQGKTSNLNALAIVSDAIKRPIPEVGLTTFRRPYTPVTFGLLAGASRGDLFDPLRTTPIHNAAVALGAPFEDVGLWKRAWYFPRAGESMAQAVNRECRTVRTTVGCFDASTLGKIEVVGPDAAEFLHRLYTNPFLKLEPGRLRYGILCRDDGFVFDDGVVGRMAPDRFHVTTTTGGAPRVLAHMEDYLQTEWPDLKVWLTSTTEQWATIAVQGPLSRQALTSLIDNIDISAEAFPHMSVREGHVCGVPTRLFRMSFTGEMGYEVNVPAAHGQEIWEAIHAEVLGLGGCPYGTEAMHVLRAEKGYIIVGQETDGTLTPADAGVGWAVGKAKRDFVGRRGLMRPDLAAKNRKEVVGLLTLEPRTVLEEGAQIVPVASPVRGEHAEGHVTSSYWSETLGRSIALCQLEGGRSRIGQTVYIPMQVEGRPGRVIPAMVADPVFVDPEGGRLNG